MTVLTRGRPVSGAARAVLCGLGAAVPERVVSNDDLSRTLDTSDAWIRKRTGIHERRVAGSGLSTGDLAVTAGARALKSAGVTEVGAVVLATTTPDHPCPATAPRVAYELGLGHIPAFDIAAVCSGFLYGLGTAEGLIAAGLVDSVLLIGAEVFTSIVDPRNRATAPLFGDGAGAVVLRAGRAEEPGCLLDLTLHADGELADLIMVPGGGSRQRGGGGGEADPAAMYLALQGQTVFVKAVTKMEESCRSVLAATGWATTEVDRLVAHQANLRILNGVADRLGLPASAAYANLDRFGNTAGASIPLALASAADEGALAPGDKVLLTAFGGGATWGAATLRWPDLVAQL